jgi:uncharacterized protein with ParB-like and HNH nuclease domain
MSYIPRSMPIKELVRDIENYYLPAIQREFIWSPSKIESLFDSLMRGFPIGTFLFWDVSEPRIHEFTFFELIKNFDVRYSRYKKANLVAKKACKGILDGQQRIMSILIGLIGSYTEKIKYKRKESSDAYQRRKLYIDLLYKAKPDSDQKYQIRFLTERQVNLSVTSGTSCWFPVGDILRFSTRDSLKEFIRSHEHRDSYVFQDNLETLWMAILDHPSIIFFNEDSQYLDEVLEIFRRLNQGGTPLSYSDFLLSLMTAAWKDQNAHESIYEFVDDLNDENSPKFHFNKDFILKALLVLSDGDVRFKTKNVSKGSELEKLWEEARESLRIAVKLIVDFGLNGSSLTSNNAIIPISYYIFKKGYSEDFLTRKQYEPERNEMRMWLYRMLLGNVFSGQTDNVLTNIRDTIKENIREAKGYPAGKINDKLRLRKKYVFTEESIVRIIEKTKYGSANAFSVLALLSPGLRLGSVHFHIDHLHPRSAFTRKNLKEHDVPENDIEFCLDNFNFLPNLHLMPDDVGKAKGKIPLKDWLDSQKDREWYYNFYNKSYIPAVDLSLSNFKEFFEKRKNILVEALKERIGFVDLEQDLEEEDLISEGPAEEEYENLLSKDSDN